MAIDQNAQLLYQLMLEAIATKPFGALGRKPKDDYVQVDWLTQAFRDRGIKEPAKTVARRLIAQSFATVIHHGDRSSNFRYIKPINEYQFRKAVETVPLVKPAKRRHGSIIRITRVDPNNLLERYKLGDLSAIALNVEELTVEEFEQRVADKNMARRMAANIHRQSVLSA